MQDSTKLDNARCHGSNEAVDNNGSGDMAADDDDHQYENVAEWRLKNAARHQQQIQQRPDVTRGARDVDIRRYNVRVSDVIGMPLPSTTTASAIAHSHYRCSILLLERRHFLFVVVLMCVVRVLFSLAS